MLQKYNYIHKRDHLITCQNKLLIFYISIQFSADLAIMTLSVCKDAFEATVLTQTRWSALLAVLGPVVHSGSLKKLLVNDLLNLLVNIQPILCCI